MKRVEDKIVVRVIHCITYLTYNGRLGPSLIINLLLLIINLLLIYYNLL